MIILLQTIISKDDNKGVRMGGSIGRPRQGRAPFNRLLSSLPLVVGPTSPSHILPSSWYFPHTTICFQCNCGRHLHLKRLMVQMWRTDGKLFWVLESVEFSIFGHRRARPPPWQPQCCHLLQTHNISSPLLKEQFQRVSHYTSQADWNLN